MAEGLPGSRHFPSMISLSPLHVWGDWDLEKFKHWGNFAKLLPCTVTELGFQQWQPDPGGCPVTMMDRECALFSVLNLHGGGGGGRTCNSASCLEHRGWWEGSTETTLSCQLALKNSILGQGCQATARVSVSAGCNWKETGWGAWKHGPGQPGKSLFSGAASWSVSWPPSIRVQVGLSPQAESSVGELVPSRRVSPVVYRTHCRLPSCGSLRICSGQSLELNQSLHQVLSCPLVLQERHAAFLPATRLRLICPLLLLRWQGHSGSSAVHTGCENKDKDAGEEIPFSLPVSWGQLGYYSWLPHWKKEKKKSPWNVGNDHMHCRNVICSFIQYLTNIYRVASMCS